RRVVHRARGAGIGVNRTDCSRGDIGRQANRNRLADVRANLDGCRTERTVQYFHSVEVGLLGDSVDFSDTLLNFGIQGSPVGLRVGSVGGLDGQLANALQVVGQLCECAFSGLGQRYAVARVPHSLVQAADLGGETLGNRETCRVVLRAVDSQARRQPFE